MAVGHWVYRHTSHWNLVKLVKMQWAVKCWAYLRLFQCCGAKSGGTQLHDSGCWLLVRVHTLRFITQKVGCKMELQDNLKY